MEHELRRALERIAFYKNGLLTPFSWEDVANKQADIAEHALGWKEGKDPLPDLPHAEPKRD